MLANLFTSATAQTRAARLSGRLTDADGNPISNAVIVLCNANAKLWFMTSTDSTGAYELAQLPPNQFSIEILSAQWRRATSNPARPQIWGYSPWTDSITLQSGQALQRNIQLGGLIQQPQVSQTSPPCTPRRPTLRLSADALAGLLSQQTPPVPPPPANDANIEGQVELEAFMSNEGKVISLRLLTRSWPPKIDPMLTRAAVEAVRNWRYSTPQPASIRYEVFEFGGPIVVAFNRDR
jgi:TonB family protein